MYKISWPNRVTMTRILLIGPFVIGLLHLRDETWGDWARWWALAMFGLMAISDGLDGYLARRLDQETAIGRFLDPLADKLLILCSVVLLANEGTHVGDTPLPPVVAVIAIGKDLIVLVGFCVIYFSTARVYIDPRSWGKWCTATQLLAVVATLLAPDLPGWFSLWPKVLWGVASFLAVATVVHYFQIGMHFIHSHEEEETKSEAGGEK